MSETAGKVARVVGTFVLMIGTGLVLDRNAVGMGVSIMFVGWASFVWGLLVLYHNRHLPRSGESQ